MTGGERYYNIRAENNVDFIPMAVEGKYEIPHIKPEVYEPTEFIPFTNAGQLRYRHRCGVHFFIYDYQFQCLWNMREKYGKMLPEFKAVMTPDFSLYTDWPIMVQLWNHYRKHVLGAWMQSIGCKVYPTITWSDKRSYDFCFDGEPIGGTVCVSSVGTQQSRRERFLFLSGYEQMMDVLKPETVLFYGSVPEECTGNIVPMEPFYKKFMKGECEK